MKLKKYQQCQNSQTFNETHHNILTVLHDLVGLCDVVLSREIWLNSISDLRHHNEIYQKVHGRDRQERSSFNICRVYSIRHCIIGVLFNNFYAVAMQ